ncbi:hypothetical protein M0802_004701 [Mischocyttarus mexicanus]|nr:hypothetical protein M0802_004701 [Mischocyttarus mexicanus]
MSVEISHRRVPYYVVLENVKGGGRDRRTTDRKSPLALVPSHKRTTSELRTVYTYVCMYVCRSVEQRHGYVVTPIKIDFPTMAIRERNELLL